MNKRGETIAPLNDGSKCSLEQQTGFWCFTALLYTPMKLQVKSSNIKAVDYDETSNTLVIDFNDGTTYQFDNVPLAYYRGLMTADSKGEFFAKNIRKKFPTHRLL